MGCLGAALVNCKEDQRRIRISSSCIFMIVVVVIIIILGICERSFLSVRRRRLYRLLTTIYLYLIFFFEFTFFIFIFSLCLFCCWPPNGQQNQESFSLLISYSLSLVEGKKREIPILFELSRPILRRSWAGSSLSFTYISPHQNPLTNCDFYSLLYVVCCLYMLTDLCVSTVDI